MRADLSEVQAGELSPELQQDLATLQKTAAELQGRSRASKRRSRALREGPVPAPGPPRQARRPAVRPRRPADSSSRTDRRRARGSQPGERRALDAALAPIETRVTTLLDRQVVQNPGQLVVMKSGQLDGVQTLVRALRNLGFVLPLLVLLLYVGALYLAKGWRRRALIAAGGGILAATLLVLLTRRLIGSAVVDSVASSETVEPAIRSVWDIVSGGLRERALFVLVIGLAFVGAGSWRDPAATPSPRGASSRRTCATSRRGLLGRRRAVPALAGLHARDQQPRPGSGDRRCSRCWPWWASRCCAGRRRRSFRPARTVLDRLPGLPGTPGRRPDARGLR